MTNSGIIEGHAEYSGCSDLSLAISLCLPNGSMRVFHGAGTTDEEIAGQHRYTDERRAETQHTATSRSGGGKGPWQATALKQMLPHYRRNLGNPCVEKEARLRPQPFISSRSRMGTSIRCSCEGGSRGPASALRFTFGSGVDLLCKKIPMVAGLLGSMR